MALPELVNRLESPQLQARAGELRLLEGDANTSFFHSAARFYHFWFRVGRGLDIILFANSQETASKYGI
jgi:hypothetical protein